MCACLPLRLRRLVTPITPSKPSLWVAIRRVLPCCISSPPVRPAVAAQFWTLVPLFLLSEANLGMLGLGVSEPLPSLGNLLAEIQLTPELWRHPALLAPAALLVVVLISLQGLLMKEGSS